MPRPRNDAAQAAMLLVPGGLAALGSTGQERAQARIDHGPGGAQLFTNEGKPRRAYIAGFRLDASPVTNALYAEFVATCGGLPPDHATISEQVWTAGPRGLPYGAIQRFLWNERTPPVGRERHPVVLVTHHDAGFYCAWRGGRLPSEDEWERAARGATGNVYPWGNRFDPFRVNTALQGVGDTREIATLPQGHTAEGFTDIGGHVFEWTETPWPGRPGYVVVKGNGWGGRGGFGRGAARSPREAKLRDVDLGFRCAADR